MIKLYFLGIASLLGLAFIGIDWYMTAKKLRWEAVAEVWPFWSLLMGYIPTKVPKDPQEFMDSPET